MKSMARKLRRQSTDAERLLWKHLRSRQLKGYKFRRQHAMDPYVVDFICLEAMLIVEVDGSQHLELSNDEERTVHLESLGYRIVRYWNNEILKDIDAVLDHILQLLEL